TVVTAGGQRVERLGEGRAVFLDDGRSHVAQGLRHHAWNGVFGSDGRVLVGRVKLDDVVEAFAHLVDLVVRQLPVPSLSRRPTCRPRAPATASGGAPAAAASARRDRVHTPRTSLRPGYRRPAPSVGRRRRQRPTGTAPTRSIDLVDASSRITSFG